MSLTVDQRHELDFLRARIVSGTGRGQCGEVSRRFSSRVGILFQEGKFHLDHPLPRSRRLEEPHAWNLDPTDGTIYDGTAEQFNSGLNNMEQFGRGVAVIKPTDPRYKRYSPS